jgi:hypothetical protein
MSPSSMLGRAADGASIAPILIQFEEVHQNVVEVLAAEERIAHHTASCR